MCALCGKPGSPAAGPATAQHHNSGGPDPAAQAHLSFLGGASGPISYNDPRRDFTAQASSDAARVLDALKNPVNGYYDPPTSSPRRVPLSALPTEPYSRAITGGNPCALKGMGWGLSASSASSWSSTPRSRADRRFGLGQMKAVWPVHLGATLVESVTAGWVRDPDIEN